MRKIYFGFVVALALTAGACNHKGEEKPAATTTETPATPAADKKVNIKLAELATPKDLNCDMPLEEGSIADTASYNGKTYGFCSSECKAEFMKAPETHLPKQ